MSKPDKRYYKINIHGQEQIFTNVEKVDNYYIANGVDKDGKAYDFYHNRLSQAQIDSAVISNSMKFVEKPANFIFRTYIVNAAEYDNGNKETSGIWLEFPAGNPHIETALEEIGLPSDATPGQYFIDESTCILKCLSPFVTANTDIFELAEVAKRLDTLDGFEMMKLVAVMESNAKLESLAEIKEFTYNRDYYNFEMEIEDFSQLGEYCIYKSGIFEGIPDHYKDAINPAAFGEYIAGAEHGVFTSRGYLYPSGDEWIPKELPDFTPKPLVSGTDDLLIDTTEIFAVDLDQFFRDESGEYDFMYDDTEKAVNRIASSLRSGDTQQVKNWIYGMMREEHLDISEVRPYLNRVENFEKMKGISGKKTRVQEKSSIREQLNDGKAKQPDIKRQQNKKNDLEV